MANQFMTPSQMRADIINTFSRNARAAGVPEADIAEFAPLLADAWMHAPMRIDPEQMIHDCICGRVDITPIPDDQDDGTCPACLEVGSACTCESDSEPR